MLHTDRDLTQLLTGLCVLEERERKERERERERDGGGGENREAAMRMKITRAECAGDGNEGRVRWGSVKNEFEGSKRKGEV